MTTQIISPVQKMLKREMGGEDEDEGEVGGRGGREKRDTATRCNTLQHTATHCNTLRSAVPHCTTL